MASEVIMPQMGFDMKEGTLVRWIKREGDEVASGEIIAEIETDKAVVEIEAFDSGVLRQTLIDEGTTVPVGEVIAVIAAADEEVAERPSPSAASVKAPAMAAPAPAPPPPAPAMRGEVKASPLAKREAQKLGIDIAAVPGTGPNGRVTKKDVTDFAAGGAQAATPVPAAPAAAPPTVVSAPAAGPKRGEVIALSKMRDAIARSMTYSKQHIPHVYLTAVIDMSDAARLRAQLNAALPDDKISFNDMALKACAMALVKHPLMNASYTEAGIHVKERVNVGMAIALETGLIAPALLDTDTLTLRDVAGATKALAGRARAGKLSADEYTGATFNVTNLGMYGVEEFTAIITPPQAAALAVGAVTPTPVVRDGEVQVADLMRVTLSLDHRVADGAQGAEFLAEVRRLLENPVTLLV